jgi:hypothetical protein
MSIYTGTEEKLNESGASSFRINNHIGGMYQWVAYTSWEVCEEFAREGSYLDGGNSEIFGEKICAEVADAFAAAVSYTRYN